MKNNKKMNNKKKIIFALVILLIIGGVIFYFLNKKDNNNDQTQEEVETAKLQIVDEDSTSRSYAVMINNLDVARPYHSGLQDAYIIYEFLVEGGITRYLALFKDVEVSRIGPIRSARPYYLDYAMENDAYYVHWGQSTQALSDISTYSINNINGYYDASYFWKDSTLKIATEHTVFTSTELLSSAVSDKGYRSTTNKDLLLNYSVDELDYNEIDGAITATEITIPYSNYTTTSYTYDEETKTYYRYVNSTAHTDYVTEEQYTFKNIIAYSVTYTITDSEGHLDMGNVTSGSGYYISNGVAVPITWSKSARSSQTVYKLADGTELEVNDGNTFIQVYPTTQTISIS